ncbi:lipopolysaccharide biosynthesis protein [Sulfurimonas sp. NW15]|uniref:lipopolysaccharide biosynthesis protein n=1 Tax=Sulfurimonas sp. NW15 TaxID=2922729 RepID=UPI003DA98CCD
MEDSLKKRYAIKLLANIVNGIINMVMVAIVPRALGPLAYGQFIYLQQFFTQLIGFLDAGTSTAFFTKLSKNIFRRELIKFYFYYAGTLLIFLLSCIFFLDNLELLSYIFPGISKKYIYLAVGFSFLIWFTTIFVYISDSHALTVSVESFKIFHKILSLFLLFVFINYLSFDLSNYYYYYYISLIIFILFIIYLFVRKNILTYSIFSSSINLKSLIKEFYTFSSPLFVFNVVATVFGLFDIWLLQKIGGSKEVGFYGLAYSIAAMCFLFTSSMTPIVTREFAKSYEKHDLKEMKKLFSKYIPMLYSVAAYFGVFISFESENLLMIFTGETFQEAYPVLIIMAFYPMHQTYGQLSGSVFYVTDQTKLVRNIGIFSTLIGFFITVVLIYYLKLNAVGLAWKMVVIQVISVNIQLYFNSRYLNLKFSKFVYHQIFSVLVFVLLAYVTNILMLELKNKLIEFLLSGILYTFLVIVSTLIMPILFGLSKNNVNLKNMFKKS